MRLAEIIPGRGEYCRKHSPRGGRWNATLKFEVIKDFNSFFNGTEAESQRITMNTCCKAIHSSLYINNYECKFRLEKSFGERTHLPKTTFEEVSVMSRNVR
jgi:hypothetical protein